VNELLKEGAETKVHLDYDEYNETEWSTEEMARRESEVRGKVEALMAVYGLPEGPELSYVMATRHGRKPDGRWKRSYRMAAWRQLEAMAGGVMRDVWDLGEMSGHISPYRRLPLGFPSIPVKVSSHCHSERSLSSE
jgi:hypothetical protein